MLIGVGAAAAAAAGLALAYRFAFARRMPRTGLLVNGVRAEAVVVLGAESRAGARAVVDLASRQLVVIAAVRTANDKRSLEAAVPHDDRGYVRTVVVDTADATAVRQAVHASLSLRYPLATSGDPFAPPGHGVHVIGIVCAPTASKRAYDMVDAASAMLPLAAARDARSNSPVAVAVLTGAPDVRALVLPTVRALRKARLPGARLAQSRGGVHIEAPQKRTSTRPIVWTVINYSGDDALAAAKAAELVLARSAQLWAKYVVRPWSLSAMVARLFRSLVSLVRK